MEELLDLSDEDLAMLLWENEEEARVMTQLLDGSTQGQILDDHGQALQGLYTHWQDSGDVVAQQDGGGAVQGCSSGLQHHAPPASSVGLLAGRGRCITTQMQTQVQTQQHSNSSSGDAVHTSRTCAPTIAALSEPSSSLSSRTDQCMQSVYSAWGGDSFVATSSGQQQLSLGGSGNLGSFGMGTATSLPTVSMTDAGGSWQALLSGELENNPLLLQQAAAQPKAKRGRKPNAVQAMKDGVPITKPKKKDNTIIIKQLESELASKLSLVKNLQGQNVDLKRTERLLKISVDTSEHNMTRLQDPALDRNLTPTLQAFRGAFNRASAERVLSKVAHIKDPSEMTFELFCTCWQALVGEMSETLMAEAMAATPEAKADVQRHMQMLHTQVIDFVMAMCVNATTKSIVLMAALHNTATGEYQAREPSAWGAVVDTLELSPEQLADLVGCYEQFARLIEVNLVQREQAKRELDEAVARQEAGALECCFADDTVAVASEKLAANLRKSGLAHNMLAFQSLRLMTPRQTSRMCVHSSPNFPSVHMMMHCIKQRSVQQGTSAPLSFVPHNVASYLPNVTPANVANGVSRAYF